MWRSSFHGTFAWMWIEATMGSVWPGMHWYLDIFHLRREQEDIQGNTHTHSLSIYIKFLNLYLSELLNPHSDTKNNPQNTSFHLKDINPQVLEIYIAGLY